MDIIQYLYNQLIKFLEMDDNIFEIFIYKFYLIYILVKKIIFQINFLDAEYKNHFY